MMIAPITTQAQMKTWGSVPKYTCSLPKDGPPDLLRMDSKISKESNERGGIVGFSLRSRFRAVTRDLNTLEKNIPPLPPLDSMRIGLNIFSVFEDGTAMIDDQGMHEFTSSSSIQDPIHNVEHTLRFVRDQLFNKFRIKVYSKEYLTKKELISELLKLPPTDHVLFLWWDGTQENPTIKVTVLFKTWNNKLRLFDPYVLGQNFHYASNLNLFERFNLT